MAKLLGHMHQPKPNYLYWSGAKLVSVSWTWKKVDSRQLKCPLLRQLQHLRLFVWGTSNSPFFIGWLANFGNGKLLAHSIYTLRLQGSTKDSHPFSVPKAQVSGGLYGSSRVLSVDQSIYPLWLVFPVRTKYPQTISRFWYHIDILLWGKLLSLVIMMTCPSTFARLTLRRPAGDWPPGIWWDSTIVSRKLPSLRAPFGSHEPCENEHFGNLGEK